MADSHDQLYQHIVQAFALKDDLIDIDLNANANESGGDLNAAKQEAIEREQAVSSQLEPYFRSGLAKALAVMGDGAGAVREMEKAIALLPPVREGEPVSRQPSDMEAELRRLRGARAGRQQ